MKIILVAILAYAIGSVSFAWLVAKTQGINILKVGSGNAGFTNVYRTLGMRYAAFVLVGDILKGTLATAVGFDMCGTTGMLVASVFVILGHTFSFLIGFKGGKGVATGAGVLLFVSPITFLACALTLSVLAFVTGYMSVGSLAAAVVCPLVMVLTKEPPLIVGIFTICALFVIWMHRKNIVRLKNGTENKMRGKGRS